MNNADDQNAEREVNHDADPGASEPMQTFSAPLVGIAEIVDMLVKVSRDSVLRLTLRSDFPEPIADLAEGDVWLLEDVEKWIKGHGSALADMLLPVP